MAVRRLNYTGRKRLRQEDARIFLIQESDILEFSFDLSLAKYGLPADALVAVEAYRQTFWMRFDFGTVGEIREPGNTRLMEFDSAEGILFRVRVTSPGVPKGLLLAEADRIRPRLPEDAEERRTPLLPAKADDDLGDQIYRIDFSDRPILLINSRLGDWRSVARDPIFISLVLPGAMREILNRILHVERYFETEDHTDWRSQWLIFSLRLPGIPDMPTEGEVVRIDDWIDEAVGSFCRHFGMYARFDRYWSGEAST